MNRDEIREICCPNELTCDVDIDVELTCNNTWNRDPQEDYDVTRHISHWTFTDEDIILDTYDEHEEELICNYLLKNNIKEINEEHLNDFSNYVKKFLIDKLYDYIEEDCMDNATIDDCDDIDEPDWDSIYED